MALPSLALSLANRNIRIHVGSELFVSRPAWLAPFASGRFCESNVDGNFWNEHVRCKENPIHPLMALYGTNSLYFEPVQLDMARSLLFICIQKAFHLIFLCIPWPFAARWIFFWNKQNARKSHVSIAIFCLMPNKLLQEPH